MAAYTTLAELVQGYDLEINKPGDEVIAYVDNDVVTFVDADDLETDVLSLHPSELIEQALSLLGVTGERV